MLAVPALLMALALAGCGGNNGDDGIATAGGAGATPSAGATAGGLSNDERQLKLAECLRGQGIDVPDPEPGGGGPMLKLRENADQAKVDAGLQECKSYLPNGGDSLTLDADQLGKMRELATCMRANGVPDFPDPDADGQIRVEKYLGLDRDSKQFKAAMEKCRQHLPARSETTR